MEQTSVALVDLKKIGLQLKIFELILGNNCGSVCVCVCVCVCARMHVRCISSEFCSNEEHEFYIMIVSLSVHDFAFSLLLVEAAVPVYSDVSSVQLEACLLARFCVYYNLCDVQK